MRTSLLLGFGAIVFVTMPIVAAGPTGQSEQKPTMKVVTAPKLSSFEGPQVYAEYCAVCHGTTGKGDGPAAKALKVPPANLTTITQRYGEFPRKTIEEMILAQNEPIVAHGSREMPVWGPIFRRSGDRDVQTLITSNLIAHIRSLQVK